MKVRAKPRQKRQRQGRRSKDETEEGTKTRKDEVKRTPVDFKIEFKGMH